MTRRRTPNFAYRMGLLLARLGSGRQQRPPPGGNGLTSLIDLLFQTPQGTEGGSSAGGAASPAATPPRRERRVLPPRPVGSASPMPSAERRDGGPVNMPLGADNEQRRPALAPSGRAGEPASPVPVAAGYVTSAPWNPRRPSALVIACSDGRLQQNLDDFLHHELGITDYDRLYAPGGGGALATSGSDYLRAGHLHAECRFLLTAHQIEDMYLIFHGPAADGPEEALCADYRRKLPLASTDQVRRQQEADAARLLAYPWGSPVRVHAFRSEVRADGRVQFIPLANAG